MMHWTLAARKSRLDHLFALVGRLPIDTAGLEVQGHWARYMCVLSAGFVETALEAIFCTFAHGRGTAGEVLNFVQHEMRRKTNLDSRRLVHVVNSYDRAWAARLEELLSGEYSSALNSIISNRNRIAHGDDVNISYSDVKGYYIRVCQLLAELDRVINQHGIEAG